MSLIDMHAVFSLKPLIFFSTRYLPLGFSILFTLVMAAGCTTGNSGSGSPIFYETSSEHTSRSPVDVISDSLLFSRVALKFNSDDMVDDDGIDIKVRSGVVYLEGQTPDIYQRRIATDLARSVDGVVQVVNRLQIINPGTVFVNPELAVKKQITMALISDAELNSQPVTVMVTTDQVVLSGSVKASYQSRKAESLAISYAGQRTVINQINISD